MAKNKIIYGGQVLIDLTSDTVNPEDLLQGITAHDRTGEIITGACTYDSDTSDATAQPAEILATKTAYVGGQKVTGTMVNREQYTNAISDKNQKASIPIGYHDGSGYIAIESGEKAKLIAGNIKNGIKILGITGTYGGEEAKVQAKTVTPTKVGFSVNPDVGFDYLSSVTVNAIPYVETPNTWGTTVSIG